MTTRFCGRALRHSVNAEPDLKLIAEASNGKEAIDAFRSHQPDVTLMDLQMPEVNGLEGIAASSVVTVSTPAK
jgi:YesN/AraC family two-component response regulator